MLGGFFGSGKQNSRVQELWKYACGRCNAAFYISSEVATQAGTSSPEDFSRDRLSCPVCGQAHPDFEGLKHFKRG